MNFATGILTVYQADTAATSISNITLNTDDKVIINVSNESNRTAIKAAVTTRGASEENITVKPLWSEAPTRSADGDA